MRTLARRELLALAGAASLVGCGADGGEPVGEADEVLLNRVLGYEHAAVAAYQAGAPLLRGRPRKIAQAIADEERSHVGRLAADVRERGERPVAPLLPQEYRRSFPRLTDSRDVLRFSRDLEMRIVRVYTDVLPQLSDPRLRSRVGALAADHAAHLAVVQHLRGAQPAPYAFLTGKE